MTGEGIRLPNDLSITSPQHVAEAFRSWGKTVITFLGFGELGYENEATLSSILAEELCKHSPATTVINTGTLITEGFCRGIAEVYKMAKQQGFGTAGIHPSVALTYPKKHYLSSFVDHVFVVEDCTWGGNLGEGRRSPTLETLIAVTDEVVIIGGGKHTAEEMQEFLKSDKPARFYAADMNHSTARHWFALQGQPAVDFHGAAYHAWIRYTKQPDGAR